MYLYPLAGLYVLVCSRLKKGTAEAIPEFTAYAPVVRAWYNYTMTTEEVDAFVKEVISNLCLDYSYTIEFKQDDKEKDERQVEAEITVDTRYQSFILEVYPILCTKSKQHIKKTLIHEISHIYTQPLYDLIFQTYLSEDEVTNAWENTTEKIARVIYKLYGSMD